MTEGNEKRASGSAAMVAPESKVECSGGRRTARVGPSSARVLAVAGGSTRVSNFREGTGGSSNAMVRAMGIAPSGAGGVAMVRALEPDGDNNARGRHPDEGGAYTP
ncbi:MAG: hypothetical protein IPF99_33855 [Deltaproteobacteria bacterium]|nr:hypothetical protein [Deltaproteobacteria bacterium]